MNFGQIGACGEIEQPSRAALAAGWKAAAERELVATALSFLDRASGCAELLKALLDIDAAAPGCLTAFSPALETFRTAGAARPRIAAYLRSPLRFPDIVPGYQYKAGPVKRSAFAM